MAAKNCRNCSCAPAAHGHSCGPVCSRASGHCGFLENTWLRIDVGTSVAQLLIIPHLAEFHARYPDIQVDLGVSDRTVDLIGDNVDCVIRGAS